MNWRIIIALFILCMFPLVECIENPPLLNISTILSLDTVKSKKSRIADNYNDNINNEGETSQKTNTGTRRPSVEEMEEVLWKQVVEPQSKKVQRIIAPLLGPFQCTREQRDTILEMPKCVLSSVAEVIVDSYRLGRVVNSSLTDAETCKYIRKARTCWPPFAHNLLNCMLSKPWSFVFPETNAEEELGRFVENGDDVQSLLEVWYCPEMDRIGHLKSLWCKYFWTCGGQGQEVAMTTNNKGMTNNNAISNEIGRKYIIVNNRTD